MNGLGKLVEERLCSQCPFWVKLGRTQYEHMFSALPLNTDVARGSLTVHSGLDFFDPDQELATS